ncbi:MAG TPA: FliA/WhiG family RNA polymerase sigma factor [Bryobacteraceae bacterium]|nr:FliA/WhiG family RNA polymerase sigma factor [Bryobacteraceae bacterium]
MSTSKGQATMSRDIRNQMVLEHLPLVKAIAIRVHEGLPLHVDLDDLVHAGVLGLFDAVDKYDTNKNVAFQSYAKHRIKGAILDSLRQLDWASRDTRRQQKRLESVTRSLSLRLGRMPGEQEVAEEMGVSVARWRQMLMELHTQGPVSVSTSTDQDPDRQEPTAKSDFRPDRMAERHQLKVTIAKAIECLPERYQRVVFLYYTNDLTMREIGDLMGVNESRVSQIHKTALKKMAVVLESAGIRSAEAL